MKLLVLIVTYNRIALLKECLHAVCNQTIQNFDILIVDNNSTDGTKEYLETLKQQKSVSILRLKSNIGGSGGFYTGIKEAFRLGYSHVWLMDDDTVPNIYALEKLIEVDQVLKEYGFLVSLPLWKNNAVCKMNMPLLGKIQQENGNILQLGVLPVRKATFVSMLLKTEIVQEVGLPIKDFFIWGDDQEYTERITKKYKGYLVLSSVVLHKTENNLGSDISTDSPERIERYYYAYRNEFFTAKRNGILSLGFYFVRFFLTVWKILIVSKKYKIRRLSCAFSGLLSGIIFNPPNDDLSSLK